MRRHSYQVARALRAFRDADGSDRDWAGAIILAECIDDVAFLKAFAAAWAKGSKRRGRR